MSAATIGKRNGIQYYPVLIVGAGESGIAMGCRLKQVLGFDQFRIFDRMSGIGGTWWINSYPGIACDVPAIFYSFSFARNPAWTSLHPSGTEILRYLQDVCEKFQISDKIQLETEVTEARWLEEEELWEVQLACLTPGTGDLSARDRQKKSEKHGEQSLVVKTESVRCKILLSAAGGFVEPKAVPQNIPGWEAFEGEIIHSARWDHSVDFTDKDVVVIGTGCSAAQIVPAIAKAPYNAKSVTQLMRSPPWVVPEIIPPFGIETYRKWAPRIYKTFPVINWVMRQLVAAGMEYDWRLFGTSEYASKERKKMEQAFLAYVHKIAPKKYHEILTPNYGVCCKRRILDAGWFASLHNPKIELTTLELSSVQSHGVILGPKKTYPPQSSDVEESGQTQVPADIIVVANGFEVGEWLHSLRIIGKNGVTLTDEWKKRGGPQAYNGTAMDGFPNFFIIFGPNTATGHSSVILASENMVNFSLKFIKPILQGDISQVEVKREAEIAYTNDLQEKLKETVWSTGGCTSWYRTADGWNSTSYPYSQIRFALRSMFPTYADWDLKYTTKGLWKRRAMNTTRVLCLAAALVANYSLRQSSYSLKDLPNLLLDSLGTGLQAVRQQVVARIA